MPVPTSSMRRYSNASTLESTSGIQNLVRLLHYEGKSQGVLERPSRSSTGTCWNARFRLGQWMLDSGGIRVLQTGFGLFCWSGTTKMGSGGRESRWVRRISFDNAPNANGPPRCSARRWPASLGEIVLPCSHRTPARSDRRSPPLPAGHRSSGTKLPCELQDLVGVTRQEVSPTNTLISCEL